MPPSYAKTLMGAGRFRGFSSRARPLTNARGHKSDRVIHLPYSDADHRVINIRRSVGGGGTQDVSA